MIQLATNSPVSIFIAVNMKEHNPLPEDFLDTQELMSVLKIPKGAKAVDGVIRAKESAPYRIFKKNFISGVIEIPLRFAAG